MPFASEFFWALKGRATFWAIFEKFLLVPPLHFFRKCGFWVTLQNLPWLGHSGSFGSAFCAKIFSSLITFTAFQLEYDVICASAVGPFKRGLLFRRFLKNLSWSPLFTFSENAGFGWPCDNYHNLPIRTLLELLCMPKSSPVFAL